MTNPLCTNCETNTKLMLKGISATHVYFYCEDCSKYMKAIKPVPFNNEFPQTDGSNTCAETTEQDYTDNCTIKF